LHPFNNDLAGYSCVKSSKFYERHGSLGFCGIEICMNGSEISIKWNLFTRIWKQLYDKDVTYYVLHQIGINNLMYVSAVSRQVSS
jgi:hypothetical protein